MPTRLRLQRQLLASSGGNDDTLDSGQLAERARYGVTDRGSRARSSNVPEAFVEIDGESSITKDDAVYIRAPRKWKNRSSRLFRGVRPCDQRLDEQARHAYRFRYCPRE